MNLTRKQIKILKWVGYPLLGLTVFIFTLAYTFPYSRVKGKIIESLSDKYDVSIMSVESGLIPGTFYIKSMMLRTRPKTPSEKPVTVVIDEVKVDVGVISGIFWGLNLAKLGVEVEAKIGGGLLEIEVEHDRGDNTLVVAANTELLPIASMPGVAEAVGLPMTGRLNASLGVTLPQGKWSKAEGEVEISCANCTVGDGVAKMKMKPRPGSKRPSRRAALFQGDGLTVPRLSLGVVSGKVLIKKGKGTIQKMAARSRDGFLNIEGNLDFKDPFKETLFPGCMTFGFSEDLKKREPKFMGIEAGLPPQAKQDDGSYQLPTIGKLVDLRFDVRRQCGQKGPTPKTKSKGSQKTRSTPRLSTNPEPAKTPKSPASGADSIKKRGPLEGIKSKATNNSDTKRSVKDDVQINGPALSKPSERDEDDQEPEEDDEDEEEESEDEDEEEDDSDEGEDEEEEEGDE